VKIAETDFQAWMGGVQARMESVLARVLPAASVAPARLHEAMRYATLEGGKRVRPLLAFAAGEVSGAPQERVEIAAAAVEMIHAYSLVHDDMPCMDDDVLRRGKPTVHVQYGEPTALLVGDALQSLAFQLLSEHRLADDARTQLDMVKTLAVAAGSRGMAGGQQIDLEATGKALTLPELEFMHVHKTGAIIRAAVLLGASCGEISPERKERLDHYAKAIGLAFPGGGRRARLRRQHRHARQDRRQGFEAGQADLCVGDGPAAGAAIRRGAARAGARGAGRHRRARRRLAEVADFIVLRKF
jgi:farnesyl diphosphate synthase